MNKFLSDAITKYYEFSSLNLLPSISVNQKSEVGLWAKIKALAALHFFLEALGENPFLCFLHLLKTAFLPWPIGPFHFQSQHLLAESFSHLITDTNSSVFLFHI